MNQRIGDYLNFYRFGIGSMQYCLGEISRIARPIGNGRIDAKLQEATQKATAAARLEYDWSMQKDQSPLTRKGAAELDNAIDATVTAIHDLIGAHEKGRGPTVELASGLRQAIFPAGVFAITSPRFEEQHSRVGQLLQRLEGPYASHVQSLGLQPLVAALKEKHLKFAETLSLLNQQSLSFDTVASARAEAEDAFCALLFVIFGELIDDREALASMLAPVEDQQARMRSYLKRRGGSTPAVDPNTGDFVDGGLPARPVEPAEA